MRRTLIHYWPMNLAVIAGAAVASAVLTGALLVGDSVRASLRELTLERLGEIDHALTGQRFFRQELARELAQRPDFGESFEAVAPVILLQGSASFSSPLPPRRAAQHAETRSRASRVGVQGVDERFLAFFADGDAAALLLTQEDSIFPPALINESLRAALGAEVGDDVLISLKRWSEVPRGSVLGRKDTSSVVETVRLRVAGVLPDRGLGRFGLAVHQASSYNVFVPLAALQKALDQEGTVNGLVVAERGDPVPALRGGSGGYEGAAERLDRMLEETLTPEDLGLIVEPRDGYLSIESQEFILKPALSAALEEIAADTGSAALPVLTYLVNRIRLGDREVPYSTVSALDTAADPAFGRILLADGTPAVGLGDDEVLLNVWTAKALAAAVGDRVELTYFVVGPREDLREETTAFRVAGIVAITGLAADPTLAQEYPGLGGDNMADWDPPFPIDLGKIGAADEEYWDLYRGTPKAFIATETGRRLWRNRWGDLTAMRLAVPGGDDTALRGGSGNDTALRGGSGNGLLDRVRGDLVEKLPLDAFGIAFQPVKELGLRASGGATAFEGLFVGFSMFLIASAAMLAALLFSLGVERRLSEIGLLRAVGFPSARVRRRLLVEGGLLAAVGSLVGLAGAVGYAAAMMAGLRTWWLPAVGTSRLFLHVAPLTLLIGYVASVGVVLIAVWLRVRRLRKVTTPALLARVAEPVDTRTGRSRPGGRARWTAVLGLAIAAALIAIAFVTGDTANPAIFGSAGPALLIGLLALFSLLLGSGVGGLEGPAAVLRMAAAGGARHRGRSILAATLVASASFMIVTVAAFQTDFSRMDLGRDSGTGGFTLVGESDIPLLYDPGNPDGRFELGVGDRQEETLSAAGILSLRLLPGDDTSCLNLYQPTRPRIAGVPPELVERGGFRFQKTLEETDRPWSLLDLDLGPGIIPAFGDASSMQWILKLGIGEDLEMENEAGEEIRLRLVGMIGTSTEPSIFQSEMLISESQFLRNFPGNSGWSYFLIDTPEATDRGAAVSRALESALEDYGFDAVAAAEKLEVFHAVQNTYLSTFRTLGGLGLLLGTVGLAIVLLRNTLERRGELATLRAIGFRRSTLTWMLVVENGALLLAGMVIGTAAALLTAAPNLASSASSFPAKAIVGTLAGILLFGLAACSLAALATLRIPLLPALKAEH